MAGDPLEPQRKKPKVKVFDCPNCGASIPLRAIGLTVTVACESCGSLIDVANENLAIIDAANRKARLKPLIPLGRRGKLFGDTWEVIGFMARATPSGQYPWREYLLFNPYKGFRWLTESEGHWNFVRTTKERPRRAPGSQFVEFHGDAYRQFEKGLAKVTYVIGEFYWRVKVDDTVAVEDFVHPPYVLSLEQDQQEINWSHGEYVEPEVIKAAFKLKAAMPVRNGVAANQPSPLGGEIPRILKLAGLFIAAACVIQLLTAFGSRYQVVYREDLVYRAADPVKTLVTPSFELKGGLPNVEVDLNASVQNSWLSVDGTLVNEQTGAEYEFEEGVEYYFGSDSDGPWTEGDYRTRKVLSAIPRGTYHLNYQLSGPADQNYTLLIKRGVLTWSNFLWALVLLLAFPAFVWWRNRSFEVARWSNSDFSPYDTGDDDD